MTIKFSFFAENQYQRMSSSDLRDRMDGLEWENPVGKMDGVYPGSSVQFSNQCTGGVQASPVNKLFILSAN